MICCTASDLQPVERMRAVYRCRNCGAFAYKAKPRTGIGETEYVLYKCHHTGCLSPCVVLMPVVKFRKKRMPSCAEHRPDRSIVEARKSL